MKAQCLMETDKELYFSKSYQCIQIPLLMPCRYEKDTADIWERIYEEEKTIQWGQHSVCDMILEDINNTVILSTAQTKQNCYILLLLGEYFHFNIALNN